MGRARIVLIGALLSVLSSVAGADVIEIPLVIDTPHEAGSIKSADFDLGIPVMAVSRVSLRLVGSYSEIMYINVFDPFSFAYGPAYLDGHIGDNVADTVFATVRHQFPSGAGDFDFEMDLLVGDSANWGFLSDGLGQVGLSFGPGYLSNDYGQIFSAAGGFGSVTAAVLIVTYDPALPDERQSWGTLKASYR